MSKRSIQKEEIKEYDGKEIRDLSEIERHIQKLDIFDIDSKGEYHLSPTEISKQNQKQAQPEEIGARHSSIFAKPKNTLLPLKGMSLSMLAVCAIGVGIACMQRFSVSRP